MHAGKHLSRWGHLWSGLAGGVIAALVFTTVPLDAATGDPMITGAANQAGTATKLRSQGPSTLKLINTRSSGGVGLEVVTKAGQPPFRVNRPAWVENLNVDRLDGQHASAFLGATQQATDSDRLDGQHGTFYRNASNFNSGMMNTAYFDAYQDLSASGRLDNNHGTDLLTRDQGDGRYLRRNAKAINATTVGGYGAGELIRTSYNSVTDADDSSGTVVSTPITAPTAGYLIISGNVQARHSGAPVRVTCELAAVGTVVSNTTRRIDVHTNMLGVQDRWEICATTGGIPVPAGEHQAKLVAWVYDADLLEANIWVIFIPFGPDGLPPE